MNNQTESPIPLSDSNITPPSPLDPRISLRTEETPEIAQEILEPPDEVTTIAQQQNLATELDTNPRTRSLSEVSRSSEHRASITRLPIEIIEKVFIVFVENKCPLLWSLFKTGCLPVNSEQEGLHVNSSFIQDKIKREKDSVLPLLRLSWYFYGIISNLLSRQNAYISGIRSFEGLDLFARRRAGESLVFSKSFMIESQFRKEGEPYDPALLQIKEPSEYEAQWYRDTSPKRYYSYDCAGRGTGWRELDRLERSWKPKGWEMFPSWLTGGSRPSGEYLLDGVEIVNDQTFTKYLKSLIISPDFRTWLEEHPLIYGGVEEDFFPDMNFTSPSRHLMYKIFDSLGETSMLEKLVISGNVLRNACWLAPKAVGEFHPLSRLTHLTLSLSESPSQEDSPLVRLQKYCKTPHDCHICHLLTVRNSDDGVIATVPFLSTLKHLHLRGPGAHTCANLFNADWKALDNVVIEMGTHRGICDGDILKLLQAIDDAAHNRLQMAIEITVRMCEPQHEKQYFSHHWWRIYPEPIPTVETVAQASGAGEILVLVKKLPGLNSPLYPTPRQLVELENMIGREMTQALVAVGQIRATDGIDPLTMDNEDVDMWKIIELEENEKPQTHEVEPIYFEQDMILSLQAHADSDWIKSSEPGCPRYWVQD